MPRLFALAALFLLSASSDAGSAGSALDDARELAAHVPNLRVELPAGSTIVVTLRPLAARVELSVRPRLPAGLARVARAHPMVRTAVVRPLEKGRGERLVVALKAPRWVVPTREGTALTLAFRALPGPRSIENGALLYPRWSPTSVPEVPAGAGCPGVARLLTAMRAEPMPLYAQQLVSAVARGGPCADTARLGFGEAALRLGRGSIATSVLLGAAPSSVRDRLLAVAAHLAGDYTLAAEVYQRIGFDVVGDDAAAAAECHLARGDTARAVRWLTRALDDKRRPIPARMRPDVALRIVDALILGGQARAALAKLRSLREQHPEREDDIDVRRLALTSRTVGTLKMLGGDAAPASELGDWYRALSAYTRGDAPELERGVRRLARRAGARGLGAAGRDVRVAFELRRVRALDARGDVRAVALAYFSSPELLRDEGDGVEHCDRAIRAYEALGLSVAMESVARACVPLVRAAGSEARVVRAIAGAQSLRGDERAAGRTLRYLAARDPLGAAADPRFWAAFGRALWHEGKLAQATRALLRGASSSDAKIAADAKASLSSLLAGSGHGAAARALRAALPASSERPANQAPARVKTAAAAPVPAAPALTLAWRGVEEGLRALESARRVATAPSAQETRQQGSATAPSPNASTNPGEAKRADPTAAPQGRALEGSR